MAMDGFDLNDPSLDQLDLIEDPVLREEVYRRLYGRPRTRITVTPRDPNAPPPPIVNEEQLADPNAPVPVEALPPPGPSPQPVQDTGPIYPPSYYPDAQAAPNASNTPRIVSETPKPSGDEDLLILAPHMPSMAVQKDEASRQMAEQAAAMEPSIPEGIGMGLTAINREVVEPASESLRQFGAGVLNQGPSMIYDLPASLMQLAGTVASGFGDPRLSKAGKELAELGQRAKSANERMMGTDGEIPPEQRLARLTGESLMPMGKYTAPVTGALAAARYALEPSEAEARTPKKDNPMPGWRTDLWGPYWPGKESIPPAERAQAVMPEEFVKPVKKGRKPLEQRREERAQRRQAVPIISPEQLPVVRPPISGITPDPTAPISLPDPIDPTRVTHTIETVGGPAQVSSHDLTTMGGIVAVSLGMVFAPKIYSKFVTGSLPQLRPVKDAAPGTMAMSTPGDLARTYDDVNAGALRLARRAGLDPLVLDHLDKTFRIQTRSSARSLTDAAVHIGRMETPNFSFKVTTPLAELARRDTPHVSRYLHVRDTFDDIVAKEAQIANKRVPPGAPAPGPVTVRGMTMADVLAETAALEGQYPALKQMGAKYRENLRASRNFEATGEYATLTRAKEKELNATHQNTVPFNGTRVWEEPVERGSAFESLALDMKHRLRLRMENEARGQYIDAMRKIEPSSFVRVTEEQLEKNAHWRKNAVTIYRRGKAEKYTTDPFLADVLKMDPYYFTGLGAESIYLSKRVLEAGSTGLLAPWFSVTSFLRNYQITKFTARGDRSAPGIVRSVAAIPQQLVPKMAETMGHTLERMSGGWFDKTIGRGNFNALSVRLVHTYESSLASTLEAMGTHRGSVMEQQAYAQSMQRLNNVIEQSPAAVRGMLNGYKQMLNAVHNAPQYAYVRKNAGKMTLPELVSEARGLTGDPRIGGQYRTGFKGEPFRFESDSRVSQTVASVVVKPYGVMTEIGREAVPWFNPTMQGLKRTGEAYLENPARFVGRAWTYSMMPAASLYAWSRSLGKDPNGVDYADYMVNRRTEYDRTMNWYIAIPGLPAEDGIKLPRFHELAPAARMMEVGLDHAFRSSIYSNQEDFAATAKSFAETALLPPIPPAINLAFASQGIVGPQGFFGGEAYKKHQEPFDQTGGLPASIELYARALAGGIADVVGAGYAAYTQTPEEAEAFVASKHGVKAMGRKMAEKTPILRDIVGVHPPMAGNNLTSEKLFEKSKSLEQLTKYFTKWDKNGGAIATKAASKQGGQIIQQSLGGRTMVPSESVGLTQPEPTNPLYRMFMERVYDTFKKDRPSEGGVGFQSMWRAYGDATEQLRRMRNVNVGNYVTWQQQLSGRQEQLKFLKDNGVDHTSPTAVRNFYERYRQDVAKVLLFTIRQVEEAMSKELGQPVKLEQLDPYGKGLASASTDNSSSPIISP